MSIGRNLDGQNTVIKINDKRFIWLTKTSFFETGGLRLFNGSKKGGEA